MCSNVPSPALQIPSAGRSSRRPSCSQRARRAQKQLKKEIQTYVKTNTAPYKYPRIVEFRDELPKTISGKIRRVELKG